MLTAFSLPRRLPALPLLADGPTFATPSSYADAMRAACAAVALVDAVVASSSGSGGEAGQLAPSAAASGFSICRPPGHHATPGDQMGFCLLNNAALAARHAQRAHGLHKVRAAGSGHETVGAQPQPPLPPPAAAAVPSLSALSNRHTSTQARTPCALPLCLTMLAACMQVLILDWDVHHGNGTQDCFYADPSVLLIDLHQAGVWPGSGAVEETGAGGLGWGRWLRHYSRVLPGVGGKVAGWRCSWYVPARWPPAFACCLLQHPPVLPLAQVRGRARR